MTVDLSATLVPNTNTTAGLFSSGDSITGSFTYDAAAGQINGLCCGFADYALMSAGVTDVTSGTVFDFPGNGDNPDDILIGHTGYSDSSGITACTVDYDGSGNGYRLEPGGSAPNGSVFSDTGMPPALDVGDYTLSGDYRTEFDDLYVSFAPEPGSLAVVGLGLLALGMVRRRRG